jgi:hypothetical protein
MSPEPSPILKYFQYSHLPARLQEISKPFALLAQLIETDTPGGPEKSAGLRKLLEAKDCIVRANLPSEENDVHPDLP